MNIYLKWTDTKLSGSSSISLFNLEISQEENYFGKARIVVDALVSLPPGGTEGVIVQENNGILFKGFLVGSFVKIDGVFGEIELIAKPLNFLDKVGALQKLNRILPYWDSLWVRSENQNNFQEIQDVRTSSLFCNPRTGELSLSDWFEGGKTIDVGQKFFQQSLQVKLLKPPLQACTVNVHAHWIQRKGDISNLGSQIRKAFPHGKVSTYTEKAISVKWPEPRKRLGRSGLWILKSELKPMVPLSSLYPTYSPPIPLGEEGAPLKIYRAKRHWFKPILWVRWQARQKRRETLSLTLEHDFQSLFPGKGEHKTMEHTLQNINPDPEAYPWEPEHFYREGAKVIYKNAIYKCQSDHSSKLMFEEDRELWRFKKHFHTPLGSPDRASFFLTDRGYQAAEHAMERAKVMLAKSARCLEISFEGPWEELKEVTTDTSIVLVDPRLPGGEVKGKVVKYALIAKGETGERIVQVTLLCAAGTGKEGRADARSILVYSVEDYEEAGYQIHENQVCQTPTGLSYFRYDDQGPSEGLPYGPVLRGIQLTNGPDDQETTMRQRAYKAPGSLKKALSEKPTRIQLFFKDLRTKERLDHVITVRMATPWSAPRGF